MKPYFGNILIGRITNSQTVSGEMERSTIIFNPLNETNVRFVHYPDCQQLIIWLTHPGREYGTVRLRNIQNNEVADEWPVTEKLSGSIQILWDTLVIAPGSYTIEIDWINGWQHIIEIEKLEEGIPEKIIDPVNCMTEEEKSSAPIQYRDGFGNILENEDLVLREKVNKDMARKFSRNIEYKGNFRGGTIIYTDNEVSIEFYHEMGGGNCMFYIDIPTERQWEAVTKTPLSEREEILAYVANRVKSEQAANCTYQIEKASIGFYYK